MKNSRMLAVALWAVVATALGVGCAEEARAQDEKGAAPKWTDAERQKGYVVFSRSVVEPLPPSHVPASEAIVETVSCALAREEYESIQIGVHAVAGDLKNIRLDVESDMEVKVYHGSQKSHPRKTGVVWEGGHIVLMRENVVQGLAEGKSINFWLTFHAKPDTAPGVHKGKIRIEPEGKQATVLDLEVRVRPFQLHRPRIPFGLYFPYMKWPEHTRTDEQLAAIYRDMAEHGQTSIGFYDYSPWFIANEGVAEVRPEQRRLIRCLRLAEPTGLLHPDIPWVWLFGGGFAYAEDGKRMKETQESVMKAVDWIRAEHRKNGWPELVYYGWDEPPYPQPALRRRWLPFRQVPMRLGTALDPKSVYGYSDLHDVWIMHCHVITPEMHAEAARVGAQVWMYSANVRSWELLRERYLTGIFTWANKLAGSFIWAGRSYAHQWWPEVGKPPMPMAGAETRREGVDDYRYLKMLEDCAAAKGNDLLAVEAAAWLESLRVRYNMNPHKVEPGKPLAIAEYDRIRARAADYIKRLGVVPEKQLKPPPVTFLKDEAEPFRDKSVEECIDGLASADSSVRRSAAWALYEHGEKAAPATEALARSLDDVEVRMVALRAIEAIGPKAHTAVPKLAALLADPDELVRIGATFGLGAIGAFVIEPRGHESPPPAPTPAAGVVVEPLRGALHDDSNDVSYIAGRMLSRLGPVSRRALPEAIDLLDQPEGGRRGAAFDIVANLGPEAVAAVPKLIEIVDAKKGNSTAELKCLAAIGPAASQAIPVLEKLARDNPDNPQRGRLYYTLFYIRGETADLEKLVGVMRDRNMPEWLMQHYTEMLNALAAAAAPVAGQVRELIDSGKYPKAKETLEAFLEKVKKGEGPRRMMP